MLISPMTLISPKILMLLNMSILPKMLLLLKILVLPKMVGYSSNHSEFTNHVVVLKSFCDTKHLDLVKYYTLLSIITS